MAAPKDDGRISEKEAMALIGISRPTILAYAEKGLLERMQAGKGMKVWYDRAQCEAIGRAKQNADAEIASQSLATPAHNEGAPDQPMTAKGSGVDWDAIFLAGITKRFVT